MSCFSHWDMVTSTAGNILGSGILPSKILGMSFDLVFDGDGNTGSLSAYKTAVILWVQELLLLTFAMLSVSLSSHPAIPINSAISPFLLDRRKSDGVASSKHTQVEIIYLLSLSGIKALITWSHPTSAGFFPDLDDVIVRVSSNLPIWTPSCLFSSTSCLYWSPSCLLWSSCLIWSRSCLFSSSIILDGVPIEMLVRCTIDNEQ